MDALEKEWTEGFKRIASLQGVDALSASIFAILHLEPESVAMDDIAGRTGYSLASVSNKVKTMEQMGLISRVTKPGSRKIYLTVEKDFTQLIKHILINKELVQIGMIKQLIPGLVERYKSKAKTDEEKAKLDNIRNYLKMSERYEEIVKKMIDVIDEK